MVALLRGTEHDADARFTPNRLRYLFSTVPFARLVEGRFHRWRWGMQIATDEVSAPGVGSDPDAIIALRARNDPEAFGLLYNRYAHRVISYFLLRTGNREDAEDLNSQVFVRAFEALP